MGKVVNALFASNPLYGLIQDGFKGFIRNGINALEVGAAFVSGGPVAAGLALVANSVQSYQAQVRASKRPDSLTSTIRAPIPVRVYGYGRRRYYGATLLYENDKDNGTVDVLALLDGQADGIEQVYLNDAKVTIVNGVVQRLSDKTYQNNKVKAGFTLGATPNTAFAPVIAKLPSIWTNAHRGDGIVTAYLIKEPEKSSNLATTYPQGDNVQLSAVIRGQLCFDPRDGQTRWTENPVLHLLHYLTVRRGYDYDKRILPTVQFWIDAANICDERVQLRGSSRVTVGANKGAKSVEIDNISGLAVGDTVTFNTPSGKTEANVVSAVFGNLIDFGYPFSMSIPAGSFAVYGGASEPRYRSCVSYESTSPSKDVIASFLEVFDGWIAPRGDGALVVYAGKLYEPTVTIGPDEIIDYRVQAYVEDENYVDQYSVSYVSELHDWNVVETTPWGGEEGTRRGDAISPQSPSFSQNRRLAKRIMARSNAPKRGSVTTNLAGRKARGHRYIYLDIDDAGYQPFEGIPVVVEVTSLQRDFQQGGLAIEWLLVDEEVDSWVPAIEEGYPAALGDSVPLTDLDAPTIQSVTAVYAPTGETSNGTPVTGVRLRIIGMGPERDDLTWYARWRPVGGDTWVQREIPDDDPGTPVDLLTDFVQANADMEAQIAYGQGDGRISPWSASGTVNSGFVDGRVTETGDRRVTENNNVRIV